MQVIIKLVLLGDAKFNIMEIENVFGAFDGMSCGQIALNKIGIKYKNYYASEIDPYAISVTQDNYKNTIQLGDIRNIKFEELPKIDLLLGGSPCQSFSFAGDRSGFDGKSGLFFEYVRVLKETKPTYFLLENVKMKKEWQDIISKELGVEPIEICSSLFSAQQRKRLYWTNINVDLSKLPKSNNVIADVLDLPIKNKRENKILMSKSDFKVKVRKNYIDKKELALFLRSYKTKTINEISVFCNAPKTMVEHWFRTDNSFSIPDAEYWFKLKECLKIEDCKYDKAVTEFELKNNSFDMAKRIYHIDGKHPTLTTLTGCGQRKTITDGNEMFYLNPEHCEKLQTVPLGYTKTASERQRFRMLGNGWTIDVICWLMSGITNDIKQNADCLSLW
jgi:DNA-cytosine methyltransferase